uniref:Supervillin-like n=1 Tax=Diabrotica virgifera virgifera TaxID=50390 RepID=A0A6P7G785_DIAVI
MTDIQEERNERIARYKEERRRQLAEQFATHHSPSRTTRNVNGYNKDGGSSSNTEGPRPTRASQLRAAAALSQENISSQQVPASKSSEVSLY